MDLRVRRARRTWGFEGQRRKIVKERTTRRENMARREDEEGNWGRRGRR